MFPVSPACLILELCLHIGRESEKTHDLILTVPSHAYMPKLLHHLLFLSNESILSSTSWANFSSGQCLIHS